MRLKEDLKKIVNINSYTANKRGVDQVGAIFQKWMEEIRF